MVEVVIAMALTAALCGGVYAVGLKARRFSEHNRMAVEARSLAKERLEEMIAAGIVELAQPGSTMTFASTNQTSLGYPVWRQPRIIWHAADGAIVAPADAVYAEVQVDVTYNSPLSLDAVTDTYASIVK